MGTSVTVNSLDLIDWEEKMEYIKFMGSFIGTVSLYFLIIYIHNLHMKASVIFIDGQYNIPSIG